MNNYQYDDYEIVDGYQGNSTTDVSAFMSKVFSYMGIALVVSGLTAYLFGTVEQFQQLIYTFENGHIVGQNIMGMILMFAPLGFVIFMSARFQKMSAQGLLISFFAFSVLFGASISHIFIMYSMGYIAQTFFISAATFGIMAVVGYTTSTDLSKMGSILYMALIGLIIAMLVNFFMQSPMMSYVISGIGVLIFTGLTAYDTQKLKQIALTTGSTGEGAQKAIIWGALSLYLDFVNLFLFMLRFMGGRD